MANILTTDIGDLDNATWEARQKEVMVDIASDLQRFPGASRVLNKNKAVFDGGDQYKWAMVTDGDDNFREIGYFEQDDINQVDATVDCTVDWKWVQSGCHYDRKQLATNAGKARIWNILKKIEMQMWLDFWAGVEADVWFGPSSSTDTKVPYGFLGYWLAYNATSGFNGGNHASFTSGPGGKSRTTYPKHKHYAFNYTTVSEGDAFAEVRKAYELTQFEGIPSGAMPSPGPKGHRYGMYTTYDTLAEWQNLLDSKNENIGMDLGKYEGNVSFRRTPIEWVPYLQTNHATSDPIIGVDWNDAKVVCPNKSEWMRRTPYHQAPTQSEVRQMLITSSFNLVLHTGRRHFLGAKSDPMSD